MIIGVPSLASLLFKYIGATEEKRTTDHYFHVSDLFDTCMRQVFLAKQQGIVLQQHIPPNTRMKFEVGKAVETVLVNWFRRLNIFEEAQPLLLNEDLRIQGHPDLRLKNAQLVEIKAMDPALFKISKRRPLAYHEFQVQTYLWLDKSKEAILFSATWGSEKNPFNDLVVRFNVKIGEIITRTISSLREAEAGGALPPRVCASIEDRRALRCPMATICFELPSSGTTKTAGESL